MAGDAEKVKKNKGSPKANMRGEICIEGRGAFGGMCVDDDGCLPASE